MMNESKFTDKALDCITDYVALAKLKNEKATVDACLTYISEQMCFKVTDVKSAFGDLVESEIARVTADDYKIDESIESFSKTLLTEADNAETVQKVDNAMKANKQSDLTTDNQKTDANSVRKYFIYLNLEKGQLCLCSEAVNAGNAVNKALEKLNNFLQRCTKPVLSNGILVAPITFEQAKNYKAKFKNALQYIDVTPAQKQEQPKQQTQQKQEQPQQQQQQAK